MGPVESKNCPKQKCPKQECPMPYFPNTFDDVVSNLDKDGNVIMNKLQFIKTEVQFIYFGIIISSDNPLTSFLFSSPTYTNNQSLYENNNGRYKYNYRLDVKRYEIPSNLENIHVDFNIKAPIGSKLYCQWYLNNGI